MKHIFGATIALACAFSVTPALAYTEYRTRTITKSVTEPREIHDSWRMICYPEDGIPFEVITWSSDRNVAIISSRGLQRNNRISSNHDDGLGFTDEAEGIDVQGNPRHLSVHFDRSGSYLDVTDRDDPAIPCGPMVVNSDD